MLNAWGSLRTWQTFMVAHALWYRQSYTYLGAVEALSGLPFEVVFLSFEDVISGVPDEIGVLINAGAAHTAFSGGPAWADPRLTAAIRDFVASGGGLIGIGEPSALVANGVTFQLADVLGVDQELGWGLSTNREYHEAGDHFITADLTGALDVGEGTPNIVPVSSRARILESVGGAIGASIHDYGQGRAVYLAGLPYSHANSRLLHRALYWVSGNEDAFGEWVADDPRVEVAHYPGSGLFIAMNNTTESIRTRVHGAAGDSWTVDLEAVGHQWVPTSNG